MVDATTFKEVFGMLPARPEELTMVLYHGVTNSVSIGIENASGKHISADLFSRQMKLLKDKFCILSIDDIVEYKTNANAYPPHSVVITFDDGFENNFSVAAPILAELQIPAIFYISSGMIETNDVFWVDQLEACINYSATDQIQVKLRDQKTYNIRTSEQKLSVLREIKAFCKFTDKSTRDHIIQQVIDQTKIIPSQEMAENYRVLSWDQVRKMASTNLFKFGGHSMYHDILGFMNSSELRKDISECLRMLSENLAEPITHFSYPEGQIGQYNDEVIEVLKSNGVRCSPSAIHGFNDFSIDLFNLRRIMVGMY